MFNNASNNNAMQFVMQGYSDRMKNNGFEQAVQIGEKFIQTNENILNNWQQRKYIDEQIQHAKLANEYSSKTLDDRVQSVKLANENASLVNAGQRELNRHNVAMNPKRESLMQDEVDFSNRTLQSKINTTNQQNYTNTAINRNTQLQYDTRNDAWNKTDVYDDKGSLVSDIVDEYDEKGNLIPDKRKFYKNVYKDGKVVGRREIDRHQAITYTQKSKQVEAMKQGYQTDEQAKAINMGLQGSIYNDSLKTQKEISDAQRKVAQESFNYYDELVRTGKINPTQLYYLPYETENGLNKFSHEANRNYSPIGYSQTGGMNGNINLGKSDMQKESLVNAIENNLDFNDEFTNMSDEEVADYINSPQYKADYARLVGLDRSGFMKTNEKLARSALVGAKLLDFSKLDQDSNRLEYVVGMASQYVDGGAKRALQLFQQNSLLTNVGTASLSGSLSNKDMDIIRKSLPDLWKSDKASMAVIEQMLIEEIRKMQVNSAPYGMKMFAGTESGKIYRQMVNNLKIIQAAKQ